MNLINYVDYKHSYAHAIAPELRVLNIHANVGKKPVQYLRAIIKRAMRENDVHFTEKEQQFWDTTVRTVSTRRGKLLSMLMTTASLDNLHKIKAGQKSGLSSF